MQENENRLEEELELAEEITETVEEAAEQESVETAAEEATGEETVEDGEEIAEEASKKDGKAFWMNFKEKAAQLLKKVNPVVEVEEEEAEAETEAEEETAQSAEEAEAVDALVPEEEPAPVRRKPADAFIIDFPVEEEPAPVEETPEALQNEEEPAQEQPVEEEPEKAPKIKLNTLHWTIIAAVSVILVGLLAAFVLKNAGVEVSLRENDVYYKDSYVATQDQLMKKADTVVATIGDRELTVSELQLYYMNGIYAFYSENYYYLSYLGLDLTAPLDQQMCDSEGMTWEQYFLRAALQNWQSYTIVELLAQRENFQLSEEAQAQVDSLPQQLDSVAEDYGYASAEEYLNAEMAPGVDAQTYVNFNRVYYVSNEYISDIYENQYPNNKEITLYYKENQALFEENGVTRDMGLISSVRHILIQPQGGMVDEEGNVTFSEDEWTTALSEAERILDQWRSGEATEESFATLANTYSADAGSNTTGGLYEGVTIDANLVPAFKNWATDFTRKTGDVEIVKTEHGYHIMYFVGGENYFQRVVGEQLVAERIQKKVTALREEIPMEVKYRKILLGDTTV